MGEGQLHFDPETYLGLIVEEVPGYDRLQAAVATQAEGASGPVLDLGTGTGVTARRVLDVLPGATLVGIDESAPMLAHARRAVPGADLRVQRLEDPLPAGPFGLVVSSLAVHHLDGEGKADLFRRVRAVLAPGGRFVLGDLVVPEDPADRVTEIDGDYDRPSTVDEQLGWLRAAGFDASVTWRERDLAVLVGR